MLIGESMAIDNIKIGMDVSSNGSTEKEIKLANKLRDSYEGAAKAAANMGGTAGSRTAAAKAAPVGSQAVMSGQDYRETQGITGSAGGVSSRDFAKQAQGLGGLVHVYATFAANLFAVSAAFTALKNAAQTENLVKGLDDLGAASGRSLGTLSKQLADTTGGALSLRDAMTAVSQASSAGLSNKQINDLAKVASKASQALGISMPDAISRLSRGISKIEPELLDELGIFVRVDDATEKYAITLGKSVSSLSDFEKRQAFANAVLEQGQKKFAAIEATPNPYDRLLASAADLATQGLIIVNKVLEPMIRLLAESPTALSLVFAGIVGMLLKQAIPALGNWRAELVKSAETAAQTAKANYESFRDYSIAKALEREGKAVAPIQQRLNQSIINAQDALSNTLSSKSKILAQAMSGTSDPDKMEKMVNTEINRRQTLLDKAKEVAKADTSATADKKAAYDEIIKKQEKEIANLQIAKSMYQEAGKEAKNIASIEKKSETPGIMERLLGSKAASLENAAVSKGIVAQAGMDTQAKGVSEAWKAMRDNIKNGIGVFDEASGQIVRTTKGLTGLSAAFTTVKGAAVISASAIGTAMAVIAPWLELIGLIIAAFKILDSVASGAAKEQAAYDNAVEATTSSVKTATDTIENYEKKATAAYNIDSIVAYTTALGGIAVAFEQQMAALDKFQQKTNGWDRLKDRVAGWFGKSNLDDAQKAATEAIGGILKTVELSSGKNAARSKLANILGIDDKLLDSTKAVDDALDKLSGPDKQKKLEELRAAFMSIKQAEEYTTNAAKAFVESLTEIDKLMGQMIQANAFSDLQGKLGVELVNAASKFEQALLDPLKALEDIAKLSQDPKAMAAIGMSDVTQLAKAAQLTKEISKATQERTKAVADLEKATSREGPNAQAARSNYRAPTAREVQADIDAATRKVDESKRKLDELKLQGIEFATSQTKLISTISEAGFAAIEKALKYAQQSAKLIIEKFTVSEASAAGIDTSRRETEIKKDELNIQRRLIDANYEAEKAVRQNTEALNLNNAIQQVAAAQKLKDEAKTPEEKKLAEAMYEAGKKIIAQAAAKEQLQKPAKERDLSGFSEETLKGARASIRVDDIAVKKREAAKAQVNAQSVVADREGEQKHLEYVAKQRLAIIDLAKQENVIDQATLNIGSQLSAYQTQEYTDAKEALQIRANELDYSAKSQTLNDQIAKMNKAILDAQKDKKPFKEDEYKTEKQILEAKLAQVDKDRIAKNLLAEMNAIREKGATDIAKMTINQQYQQQLLANSTSILEAQLSAEQKLFDLRTQLGQYDDVSISKKKTEAELEGLKLKYAQDQLRLAGELALKQQTEKTAKEVQTKASNALALDPTNEGLVAAKAQADAGVEQAQMQVSLAQAAIATNTQLNAINVESVKNAGLLNDKLAAQKQLYADIGSITTSLSALFGDLGTSIGGLVDSLAKFGAQSQANADALSNNAKEQKKLNDIAAEDPLGLSVESQNKLNALKEEEIRLTSKSQKDEINGQISVLNSTKKLFKEKTAAFKILDAMEKAAHTYKLLMMAKEVAMDVWKTGQMLFNSITRIGATGAEASAAGTAAVVNQGRGDPYTAFARMAAMAVLVASVLGGLSKKSISVPAFQASSDQLKETQGTGTTWDAQGNKVQTAGGIFGDDAAKANSVVKSLEILKDNSFDTLDYDNKLLRSFEKLGNSITVAVNAMIGTNLNMLPKELAATLGSTSSKKSGLIGMISSLWGSSSSSSSLYSQRLELSGNVMTAIDSVNSVLKNIATTFNTWSSSSWFGLSSSSGSSYSDTNLGVPEQVSKAFQSIMENMRDTAVSIAEQMGKSGVEAAQYVNEKLSTVEFKDSQGNPLKFEYKDLKGQELADALTAFISSVNNISMETLFPEFKKFISFGEDYGTTVIKILHNSRQVNDALISMDSSFRATTYDMSESIIDMAGSLEKFVDQAKFFTDNFLTDTEKLDVQQKAVTDQLQKLGLSTTITKDQYKKLVQAQDLSTKTGQDLYQSLMDLAPGFIALQNLLDSTISDAVSKLTDLMNSFKDFAKSLSSFRTSLQLGGQSYLTPQEKYTVASSELLATYSKAMTGDKQAMSDFQGKVTSFLDTSKTLFASSQQYVTDFNTVMNMLDEAQSYASSQVDYIQLQVTELQSHTLLLQNIDAGIAKMAGIPAAARGGYMSGLTLVGETGPELVDFTTPGRVYTADQTAGMFAYNGNSGMGIGSMVAELKQLREEVCQLRKDQQKQTGDLIISNYDANQKAADNITAAVTEAATDSAWDKRISAEIK